MIASYRVLVANPQEGPRERLAAALAAQGFRVEAAQHGTQCLAMLRERGCQALLMERAVGDFNAEQMLEQARRQQPNLAVIVVSEDGPCQEVVRLAKLGLDDYWPASLPAEEMAARLREALEERARQASARVEPPTAGGAVLIGRSRAMREVVEIIRLIAAKRSTVLISGPTGTGKELVARLIHGLSPRSAAPLVTVNCGAIPEHLLEAEFFGHVKGAFTGAVGSRVGRFEQAHGSSLFLDEIGEMSTALQAKVLRAVQEREFQRVGSSQTVRVDLRVIAATNCDLAARVARGEFRQDLYYRLNVVPIVVPSLVERMEDLPLLLDHFLEKICGHEQIPRKRVTRATLERLAQYHWPGNIRQLENAVEKAVILSGERAELYPSDFPLPDPEPAGRQSAPPEIRLPPGGVDFEALVEGIERSLIEQALERAGGNKKRAAEMLRLKRTTLSAKWRRGRA